MVLDLLYEARDIDQQLGSKEKIDAWFDAKTRGLNEWQKAALREQWGTMQHVLSSRSRMNRVVNDIVFDFSVKPRLSNHRGNAILVASSIYEACKYFELFQKSVFKRRCAVITSYNPQTRDITTEDTGANTETDKEFIYNTYTALLLQVDATAGKSKTESYEDNAKKLFREQPASMKLLIVVDKLLTGFDAPSCTYLYIDKSMQDHALFQAICRTNRLDGDDKEFGYIVDYKDLFNKVNDALKVYTVYTSELDQSDTNGGEYDIMMKDRLAKGRERLDNALEALALICEPVEPPKGELQHIHYFCGNSEIPEELSDRETLRAALYKATAMLVRAYGGIAGELEAAGYAASDIQRIKRDIDRSLKLREIIRHASGESIDLKAYEADMRHLIDTYIEADEPRKISPFDAMPLLELIVKSGIAEAIKSLPEGIKSSKDAIAETIENNVRSKIIKDHLNDPAFYDRMSTLLDELIMSRHQKAIDYEAWLKRIAELANRVESGRAEETPAQLNTPGRRALYNNLKLDRVGSVDLDFSEDSPDYKGLQDKKLRLAMTIDETVRRVSPDGWRGVKPKENVIKKALFELLQDEDAVERLFLVIERQREY